MLVCGESILTEGGLDRATGLIGVCPQFDVLWGELSGREHLLVAGHVKGLPWAQVGWLVVEVMLLRLTVLTHGSLEAQPCVHARPSLFSTATCTSPS